jgi:hypothetical protein
VTVCFDENCEFACTSTAWFCSPKCWYTQFNKSLKEVNLGCEQMLIGGTRFCSQKENARVVSFIHAMADTVPLATLLGWVVSHRVGWMPRFG